MSRPYLDHARLGDREWTYVNGWREWNDARTEWEMSAPPPPDAEFFNYRKHILGGRNA